MKTDVIVSYFKCALSGKYRFLVDFFYKSRSRVREVWKKWPLMYPSDIQVIQYGSIFPHRIKDHYNHCLILGLFFKAILNQCFLRHNRMRNAAHGNLKYWVTVKGCPSLTQSPSLLWPWWMGSEFTFSLL